MSPWALVLLAGVSEIAWAASLKPTEGFTRLGPSVLSIVLVTITVFLLTKAAQGLPLGTAYAVFTGMGAVGAGVIGITVFGDPPTAARLFPIAMIAGGVILLHAAET